MENISVKNIYLFNWYNETEEYEWHNYNLLLIDIKILYTNCKFVTDNKGSTEKSIYTCYTRRRDPCLIQASNKISNKK